MIFCTFSSGRLIASKRAHMCAHAGTLITFVLWSGEVTTYSKPVPSLIKPVAPESPLVPSPSLSCSAGQRSRFPYAPMSWLSIDQQQMEAVSHKLITTLATSEGRHDRYEKDWPDHPKVVESNELSFTGEKADYRYLWSESGQAWNREPPATLSPF